MGRPALGTQRWRDGTPFAMFVEKAKRLLYLLVVQPALQLAARLVGLRRRLRELGHPPADQGRCSMGRS